MEGIRTGSAASLNELAVRELTRPYAGHRFKLTSPACLRLAVWRHALSLPLIQSGYFAPSAYER